MTDGSEIIPLVIQIHYHAIDHICRYADQTKIFQHKKKYKGEISRTNTGHNWCDEQHGRDPWKPQHTWNTKQSMIQYRRCLLKKISQGIWVILATHEITFKPENYYYDGKALNNVQRTLSAHDSHVATSGEPDLNFTNVAF